MGNLEKALVGNKSVTSVIDSASHGVASLSVADKYIYFLWLKTRGLQINESVDIDINEITLHLTKVDDGIYSGHVTKKIVDMADEIPLHIEKRTLPEIVSMLEIKEYVAPKAVENAEQSKADSNNVSIKTSEGGTINISINIQKSLNAIANAIKSGGPSIKDKFNFFKKSDAYRQIMEKLEKAKVPNKEQFIEKFFTDKYVVVKSRKSPNIISTDLFNAFVKLGWDKSKLQEEIKKSNSIEDLVNKLPDNMKHQFMNRLNGQKTAHKLIDEVKKAANMPEALNSKEDIIKAKKSFKYMLNNLEKIRGKQKASSIVFALFKSKYGKEGIKKINQSIKDRNFNMIKANIEPVETEFNLIDSPEKPYQHLKFKE